MEPWSPSTIDHVPAGGNTFEWSHLAQRRPGFVTALFFDVEGQGSLNVPIEHHPTIRYMVHNGYYKVMSNIPKMGHLPTPEGKPTNQMDGQ